MAKEEKTKEASIKKTTSKKEAKTTKKETKSTPKKAVKKTSVKTQEIVRPVIKEEPVKEETKPVVVPEEPHYGRTLMAAIIIFLIFVGGYVAVQWNKGTFKKDNDQTEEKYQATEDEKRFKKEYESLNGTTRSNGQKNRDVNIKADNNIKYITIAEAAEIIDSGSGVIYFGFAACPWCRNAVPILLDARDSTNLDTIYYVDIRPEDKADNDIRDSYALDTKNKPKKVKDGATGYDEVVLALASELKEYKLPISKTDREVSTGRKRLYAPTVITVNKGIVTGFHEGTFDEHEKDENGALPDLTKKQQDDLFTIYSDMITKYLGTDCGENTEGC